MLSISRNKSLEDKYADSQQTNTWCDVIIEQGRTLAHKHGKIVLDNVFRFDTILNENCTAHDVKNNVSLNQEFVGP